jgi:hypothetical protein
MLQNLIQNQINEKLKKYSKQKEQHHPNNSKIYTFL